MLSIKAKDPKAKASKQRKKKAATVGATAGGVGGKKESGIKATLGDIFKEQMSNHESEEGEKE